MLHKLWNRFTIRTTLSQLPGKCCIMLHSKYLKCLQRIVNIHCPAKQPIKDNVTELAKRSAMLAQQRIRKRNWLGQTLWSFVTTSPCKHNTAWLQTHRSTKKYLQRDLEKKWGLWATGIAGRRERWTTVAAWYRTGCELSGLQPTWLWEWLWQGMKVKCINYGKITVNVVSGVVH